MTNGYRNTDGAEVHEDLQHELHGEDIYRGHHPVERKEGWSGSTVSALCLTPTTTKFLGMQDPVSTCKAWQFSSNGVITDSLAIKAIPIPSTPSLWSSFLSLVLRSYGPHPGVLIRVAAASLNPVDYKMIYPGSPAFIVRKPGIPGSDFSGVVISALKGGNKQLEAVGLAPGMRVYGYLVTEWRMLLGTGTMAEYIIAYPPLILPIPSTLSFEQCSSVFLAGMSSWQALIDHGKLKVGQKVFINGGSGGTGIWGIQICKAMGAYVSTTCSESSREMLESLKVDELIDYRRESLIDYLLEHHSQPSTMFDLIFDCVGTPLLFEACPPFLHPNGRFLDITSLANSKGIQGHAYDAFKVVRNIILPAILGGTPRTYIPVVLRAGTAGESFRRLDELLRQGKIQPVLDSVHSFENLPSAFGKLMSGRSKGKVVVQISRDLCRAQQGSEASHFGD